MKLANKNALTGLSVLVALALVVQTWQVVRLNQKVAELQSSNPLIASPSSNGHTSLPAQPSDPFSMSPFVGQDPFDSMRRMQTQFDQLFNSLAPGAGVRGIGNMSLAGGTPEIEIDESSDQYRVTIAMPENADLNVATSVEDNTLHISGTVTYSQSNDPGQLSSMFSSRSQFSRAIPLADSVDPLAMSKYQEDENIVITLPKV